jgi:hypothetical protein
MIKKKLKPHERLSMLAIQFKINVCKSLIDGTP